MASKSLGVEDMLIIIEAQTERMRRELRSAERGVGKFARKTDGNLRKLEQSFSRMEKNTSKSARAMRRNLVVAAASIGAGLSIKEVAEYADIWTATGNKLLAAGESAKTLSQRQDELVAIALETRSAYEPVVDLYARMRRENDRLNLSQKSLNDVVRITALSFKTGGASASEQASGILQLSQAISSGILAGDELRSIRENAPILAKAIADFYGVTVGALKKLGAEGKITAKDITAAILQAGPEIEAAFGKTTMTLGESFTNLKTIMIEGFGVLNTMIGVTTGFAKSLNETANELHRFIQTMQNALNVKSGIGGVEEIDKLIEKHIAKRQELRDAREDLPTSDTGLVDYFWNTANEITDGGVERNLDREIERLGKLRREVVAISKLRNVIIPKNQISISLPKKPAKPIKAPTLFSKDPKKRDIIKETMGRLSEEIAENALLNEMLGKSSGALARAQAEQRILTQIKQADITMTRMQSLALKSGLDDLERSIDASQRAQLQFKDMEDIGRTMATGLERAFGEFTRSGRVDFKEMTRSMLADMAKLLFRASVIRSLFGATGGGGSIGSLLTGAGAGGGGAGIAQLLTGAFGGFRADGGPVSAGKSYITGERGPELFLPKVDGFVHSNTALQKSARQGSSAQTAPAAVTITYQIDARGAQAGVAEQIEQTLRAYDDALPGRMQSIQKRQF